MSALADNATPPGSWLRRNGGWLLAATALGIAAFYLPWRINQRELERNQPRNRIEAAPGWSEYEQARWRVVAVRRQPAGAGALAEYQHAEASLLLVDYEVIPGPRLDARRLDQCKGRLVDRTGRTWEANAPAKLSTWMARGGISGSCGSRVVGRPAVAVPGRPFAFTHGFLIPADTPTQALHADVFFPPSTTRPRMGTYLRFALPAPRN